jgi:hypothetical protein
MAFAATLSSTLLSGPKHVHASRSSRFSAKAPIGTRQLTRAVDMTSSITDLPSSASVDVEQKLERLITTDTIKELESVLDNGASVAALRRFNDLLAALPADSWEDKLAPVMNELAYNLESFNPAFAAVVLRVQCTIGKTDYVRRGASLSSYRCIDCRLSLASLTVVRHRISQMLR